MSKEATSERFFTFSTLVMDFERILEVYKRGETSPPVMPVIRPSNATTQVGITLT
jgi:hypothetical protein